MDSIAMVEGEMKEISKQKCLKRLNLLTNTSKSNFCSTAFTSCFWKESSYLRRRKETIHAKVKAASYDKIYAVAKAGSAKHVQQHLQKSKKKLKLYLLKKN
jgi:polyribonucleotide nucleotidyltransferase